jgi:anti-sigma factor RsiW
MTMGEMACRELVEVVTDYLEGALGEDDRARFEAHLAGCEGCQEYVLQIRQTIEVVGRVGLATLSPELQHGLMDAFRSWRTA